MATKKMSKSNRINEVSEMEELNRRTQERLDAFETVMIERAARAAYKQVLREKCIHTVLKIAGTVIVSVTICVAFSILAWLSVIPLWIGIPGAFISAVVGANRCGYMSHEMEGYCE